MQKMLLKQINRTEILDLAFDLIKIPSFATEETPLARFLAEYMEKRGIETELQEVEKGRYQVLGTLRGNGTGPTLMFNGHLDNDPPLLGMKRDPWRPTIEGDRLYGHGVFNMKGGVTAMVKAVEAIKNSGIKLRGNLVVAAVVGELQGGVGTVYLLEKGIRPDMAIITEPMGVSNITTVHAGVAKMAISTLGVSQHISRMEYSVDALQQMVKVIQALREVKFTCEPRADLPGLPRLLVSTIIGGRGQNHELRGVSYVCDYCTIIVDVRFIHGQTPQSVKRDIVKVLEKLKRQEKTFRYQIRMPPDKKFKGQRIFMWPLDIPTDAYIVQELRRNYKRVTGEEPERIGANDYLSIPGNDTGHFWRQGIPCCLFGPGGGYVEERDSYTSISEIMIATKVLALTGAEVCSGRKAAE
jgi:acetylornithine deacetylase